MPRTQGQVSPCVVPYSRDGVHTRAELTMTNGHDNEGQSQPRLRTAHRSREAAGVMHPPPNHLEGPRSRLCVQCELAGQSPAEQYYRRAGCSEKQSQCPYDHIPAEPSPCHLPGPNVGPWPADRQPANPLPHLGPANARTPQASSWMRHFRMPQKGCGQRELASSHFHYAPSHACAQSVVWYAFARVRVASWSTEE
eukprot:scaffold308626_cov33-Tisochrysis_lutea.AAC.2